MLFRSVDRTEQGSDWLSRKTALPEKPALSKASERNIKIIRYADVLLMNAEAAYHMGGKDDIARTRVNAVRQRARNSSFCLGYAEGKTDYSAIPENAGSILPDLSSSISGQQLLEAIWQERRVELAMEQLRFFDLVRTGRFLSAMSNEKDTERRAGGKYENMYGEAINEFYKGIREKLEAKCFDGPNGNKVFVFPIPLTEVQSWGLTQNKGY